VNNTRADALMLRALLMLTWLAQLGREDGCFLFGSAWSSGANYAA
jgi:hypothetical protein